MLELIDTDLDTLLEVENIIVLGQDIINDLDLVINMLFTSGKNINYCNTEFILEKISDSKINIDKFELLLKNLSDYEYGFNIYEDNELEINGLYENLKFMNETQLKLLAFSLEKLKLNLININSGLIYYNKKLLRNTNLIN